MADNTEFPYLSIKNWDKYQPGRKGKSGWIKDYADKDFDDAYMELSFFQRQVLDGLRRLRARLGKNVPNKVTYISQALHAIRTDRPHVQHALCTLISRGLLVPCNQQIDESTPTDKELDKDKEEDKEKNIGAKRKEKVQPISQPQAVRPEASSGLKAVMLLPLNSGEEFPISEEDFGFWKKTYPAVDVLQELRSMVAWLDSHPTRKKTRSGVKAFVNSWLSRAQNNPSGAALLRQSTGPPVPLRRGRDAAADLDAQLGVKQ